MQHTKAQKQTTKGGHKQHANSAKDQQICTDCSAWMRQSAEKCRAWREESESAVCKGGLATAAFVCDSLALSMEKCMTMMRETAT